MSKVKGGKAGQKSDFYFWGMKFDPVAIADSWRRFFMLGESAVPEEVRERARVQLRAATINYVHAIVSKGTRLQKDATLKGLKSGASVLMGQQAPLFYERETLVWFETLGDGLFMLWDPKGAEALRDMAKHLKGWEGGRKAEALAIAERFEENAKLLEQSKSLPSLRKFEDAFKWMAPLGL